MTRAAVPWFLVGALLCWVMVQGQCSGHAIDAVSKQRDVLRATALEREAVARGWQTRLVEATADLGAKLRDEQHRSAVLQTEKTELAREVEVLGGRLATVLDLYVQAQGQIVAHAETHGEPVQPDSITAPLDDGLLRGRVAYFPGPEAFELSYVARVTGAIVTAEAADGRVLVSARATDPRVVLGVQDVLVAAPRVVEHCGIWDRAKAAGLGIGLWEIGRAAVRELAP